MKTRLFVVAGLALSLVGAACEEKKAERAAPPAEKPAAKNADAGATMADKAKEGAGKMVEAGKEAAGKAVEAGKEAATKAVESGKEAATKAAAAVSDEVKGAMKGYIDSLGESTGILAKITGPLDAGSQLKPLGEALAKNAGFAAVLEKATPDVRSSLKGDFGGPLDAAMKSFTEQKDRVTKDAMLGKVLGDTLSKFKAFSL